MAVDDATSDHLTLIIIVMIKRACVDRTDQLPDGQLGSSPETAFEEIGSRGKFISALPPGLDLKSVADLQPRSVRAQTAELVPSRLFANCPETGAIA
jgi:hypothetical protein